MENITLQFKSKEVKLSFKTASRKVRKEIDAALISKAVQTTELNDKYPTIYNASINAMASESGTFDAKSFYDNAGKNFLQESAEYNAKTAEIDFNTNVLILKACINTNVLTSELLEEFNTNDFWEEQNLEELHSAINHFRSTLKFG